MFFKNERFKQEYNHIEERIEQEGLNSRLVDEYCKMKKYDRDPLPFDALKYYAYRHGKGDKFENLVTKFVLKVCKDIQKSESKPFSYE